MGRRTFKISIEHHPGMSKQKVRDFLPDTMPLFSLRHLVGAGLIDAADAPVLSAVREYNPMLFDFLLKRRLRWHGHRLSPAVFESRRALMS